MSSKYKQCTFCKKEIGRRLFFNHENSCIMRPDAISPVKFQPGSATNSLSTPTKDDVVSAEKSRRQKKCNYCDFVGDYRTVSSHSINCIFQPKLFESPEKDVSVAIYDENSCSIVFGTSDADKNDTDFSEMRQEELDSSHMSVDSDSSGSSSTGESYTSTFTDNSNWPEDINTEEETEFNELESFIDEQINATERSHAIISALSLFLLMWSLTFFVSMSAVQTLLSGLRKFFDIISHSDHSFARYASSFPSTNYGLEKMLCLNKEDGFETKAVCEKCHANYKLSEISLNLTCTSCGTRLGRWLKTKKEKVFRPFYTFAYRPLSWGLQELLCQSSFEENCLLWKKRRNLPEKDPDLLYDVHDGALWNNGLLGEFCHGKNNYLFMLNFDFFPPYERSSVSIGCLYCVCLNLPVEIRYKKNNWIVIGILPWIGKEPSDISSYFQPVIDDLNSLWNGVEMSTYTYETGTTIRGAILGSSSDMPATRKLLGFKTFHAHKGCSKCYVNFGNRVSCSTVRDWGTSVLKLKPEEMRAIDGTLKLPWKLRRGKDHRSAANSIKKATKKRAEEISKETGYFENVFLQLPYYNSIKMHTIDPMHCLFEGVAKHVFDVWLRKKILKKTDMDKLDVELSKVKPPPDFDRLPTSISNHWRQFKAVQWMHWVLHYSPLFVTGRLLPQRCREYWFSFVEACRAVTVTQISKSQLKSYTDNYVQFLINFTDVHGVDDVVPNMHMALHLEDVIIDFGPVYSFWLYPFERYNGILGSYPNNGHANVQCQLMRRFLTISKAERLKTDLSSETADILNLVSTDSKPQLLPTAMLLKHQQQAIISSSIMESKIYSDLRCITFPSRCSKSKLNLKQTELLLETYHAIYNENFPLSEIQDSVIYYTKVIIGRNHFWSRFDNSSSREAIVLVKWRPLGNPVIMQATVLRYFLHKIKVNGKELAHLFASVMYHPSGTQSGNPYHKPAFLCRRTETLSGDSSCFVPIQHVLHRCICRSDPTSAGTLVCVPLVSNCVSD